MLPIFQDQLFLLMPENDQLFPTPSNANASPSGSASGSKGLSTASSSENWKSVLQVRVGPWFSGNMMGVGVFSWWNPHKDGKMMGFGYSDWDFTMNNWENWDFKQQRIGSEWKWHLGNNKWMLTWFRQQTWWYNGIYCDILWIYNGVNIKVKYRNKEIKLQSVP